MPAFLVPVEPGLCVIPLEKAIVLIGRQADCDVSLTQSRKVSRKHCCLAQVNHRVMVRDLGSTNGVFVNGVRVKKEGRVKLGDELMIGDLKFRLQTDPKAPRGEPQKLAAEKSPAKEQPAEVENYPSMDFPVVVREDLPPAGKPAPFVAAYRGSSGADSGPLIPMLETEGGSSEEVIPLRPGR